MRALHLSCADFTFPLLGHAEAIKLVAMMGFRAVDVGVFVGRSHVRPEHLDVDPAAAGVQLRRAADDCGVDVADVFVQLGAEPSLHAVSEPDPATRRADRARFQRCAEFAHAAGARHMTGLPGVLVAGTADGGIGLAADETAWRLEAAARADLTYAIEPHVGSNCPTVAATQAFLDRVPGLTLTLDYGHFVYQDHDPRSPDDLLPRTSHFHARGGAPRRLQAPLARNVIDFAPMVRAARERPSPATICVEYVWVEWEGCNEVDNVSEAILMRRHLETL